MNKNGGLTTLTASASSILHYTYTHDCSQSDADTSCRELATELWYLFFSTFANVLCTAHKIWYTQVKVEKRLISKSAARNQLFLHRTSHSHFNGWFEWPVLSAGLHCFSFYYINSKRKNNFEHHLTKRFCCRYVKPILPSYWNQICILLGKLDVVLILKFQPFFFACFLRYTKIDFTFSTWNNISHVIDIVHHMHYHHYHTMWRNGHLITAIKKIFTTR